VSYKAGVDPFNRSDNNNQALYFTFVLNNYQALYFTFVLNN